MNSCKVSTSWKSGDGPGTLTPFIHSSAVATSKALRGLPALRTNEMRDSFTIKKEIARRQVEVPARAFGLYVTILSLADAETGRAFHSVKRLASESGFSKSQVVKSRNQLIAAGWVEIQDDEIICRLGFVESPEVARAAQTNRQIRANSNLVRKEADFNRAALFYQVGRRDGFRCACCGSFGGDLAVDHIRPVSRGGGSELENLQLLCTPCNSSKGTKEIDYRQQQPLTSEGVQ